jgi:hypothetical protein
MAVLPIVLTTAGWSPTPPATFRAQLVASVTATNYGYTANLPGSMIEDVSSTDVYALVTCDAAFGDLINSVTPYGANAFILAQLGEMLGLQPGQLTNTSVYVVFTSPSPGFVIAQGFTVSDGTYQYVVQDGGAILSSGQSAPLYAVATIAGSWAVAAGTVSQLITSVPSSISLSVTNLAAGVASTGAEDETSYRSRVLQANLAASQGMTRYLKTLVANVPGVQSRLLSVQQQVGGGWQVIVGGGDPYAVAYAIYSSLFDISTLTGAVLSVSGITKANPGVVTTAINHNYQTGQVVTISGSTVTQWNGNYTIIVLTETTFSIGVNTSTFTTYAGGGICTPVLPNVTVSLNDYPDTYSVPFINPPQQTVAMTVTWNTTATNYVNPAAISQLAVPALVNYVNSVAAGRPLNVLEMTAAFQAAIVNTLPLQLLTRLVFAVSINGVGTPVNVGTQIIVGDPISYFETNSALITVNQG